MDYKPKYLKYKSKYLNLKKQMGGDIWVGKYGDNSVFEGQYYKDGSKENLKAEGLGVPVEKFGWTKCEILGIEDGYYYATKNISYGFNTKTNEPFSMSKKTIVLLHNINNSGEPNSFDKHHIEIQTIAGHDINADNKFNIIDLKKIENGENDKNINILNNFFVPVINKITYDGKEIKLSFIIYNSTGFYDLVYFFVSDKNTKDKDKYKHTILTAEEIEKFKSS